MDHMVRRWPCTSEIQQTKQGLIDRTTFEDWFSTHLLPILKKQEGRKVIIRDNLSSHISLNVVRMCEENYIQFIYLPPNSSHLTQPLDVAKRRQVLTQWRVEVVVAQWTQWQSESGKTQQPRGRRANNRPPQPPAPPAPAPTARGGRGRRR